METFYGLHEQKAKLNDTLGKKCFVFYFVNKLRLILLNIRLHFLYATVNIYVWEYIHDCNLICRFLLDSGYHFVNR